MSEEIKKALDLADYSSRIDKNARAASPITYSEVIGILYKNVNGFKIKEERKQELLSSLETATDLRVLPKDITDMLSKIAALELMKLNDKIRKDLGLPVIDYSKALEVTTEKVSEEEIIIPVEEKEEALKGRGK